MEKYNELIYQVKTSFIDDCEELDDDIQAQFHFYDDSMYVVIGGSQVELKRAEIDSILDIMNMKYGGGVKCIT